MAGRGEGRERGRAGECTAAQLPSCPAAPLLRKEGGGGREGGREGERERGRQGGREGGKRKEVKEGMGFLSFTCWRLPMYRSWWHLLGGIPWQVTGRL